MAASARMSGTRSPWSSSLKRGTLAAARPRAFAPARARARRARRARAEVAEYFAGVFVDFAADVTVPFFGADVRVAGFCARASTVTAAPKATTARHVSAARARRRMEGWGVVIRSRG